MKYILLILFSYSLLADVKTLQGDFETGIKGETNVFYFDDTDIFDSAYFLKPDISLHSPSESVPMKIFLNGEYNKYFINPNVDFFNFTSGVDISSNPKSDFSMGATAFYTSISDPPVSKTGERVFRNLVGGEARIDWILDEKRKLHLNGGGDQEIFQRDDLQYLNSQRVRGSMRYAYLFLPETAMFIEGQAGLHSYPTGTENIDIDPGSTRVKYSNFFTEGYFGFKGRLTEFSNVNAKFGFAIRSYQRESNFAEPVFSIEFDEQLSPQDLIKTGYIYRVEDSYFTNWVLDQNLYLVYARVFGDSFVANIRMEYIYRSYSNPFRREDQRAHGTLRMEYSYLPSWTFVAQGSLDVTSSDARNTQNDAVDPAASYEQVQAQISLVKSF